MIYGRKYFRPHSSKVLSRLSIGLVLHSVRNARGNCLHFLGFVLLSLIFWFMQGLNEEVENSFKIPIELQNLPEKTTLINDLPSHIEVRVRDKGPVMLGYAIEGLSPLRINFQEYDKGRNSFLLLSSQLETILRKSLRSSTSIVSIIPDTLKVMYTHNAGKRVKLVVKGVASTTPQCVLSGDMIADVDSVMVYGESSLLKRIKEVYTTDFEAKKVERYSSHGCQDSEDSESSNCS